VTTLRRGSTGADVTDWQEFLRSQGFSSVEVDGSFGPLTEGATRAFQTARGLTPDGVVGPLTQAAAAALRRAPPAAPVRTVITGTVAAGRLSAQGRELIKSFEGLRLTAYPDGQTDDGAQLYSIGYGHNGVAKGATISRAEADRLFDADVARFERRVASVTPRAAQHEFDAFVSLAYNIGEDAFARSTAARRHNGGDRQGAADAIEWFDKADGVVNPILERRRERERDVYLHGYGSIPAAAPSSPGSSSSALPLLLALGGGAVILWMSQRARRAA
jgi:lysozyme